VNTFLMPQPTDLSALLLFGRGGATDKPCSDSKLSVGWRHLLQRKATVGRNELCSSDASRLGQK
jgi:hypothetical protein